MGRNALVISVAPTEPTVPPAVNLVASRTASPAVTLAYTWPLYSDPYRQALSN